MYVYIYKTNVLYKLTYSDFKIVNYNITAYS